VSLDGAVERVLHRLSAGQVEALATAAEGRTSPGGALGAAVVGAQPGAQAAVAELAQRWAATSALTGTGVALALRVGLAARSEADARRSRPVWTGPGAVGEQRLTTGVLHELVASAQRRILLVSFAAHTLPSLAADLEQAAGRGCTVDVVFETQDDSAGAYQSHEAQPFHRVAGIRRWRWPAEQRPADGAVLHAKALVVDGRRALVGSANLTQRALTANLEVGVLVGDPAVAGAIETHVHGLMDSGVLTRS
jgi:phosphatidylserine/phosphatidylglycerophosphate/cardiolipin synthase-like enzyme